VPPAAAGSTAARPSGDAACSPVLALDLRLEAWGLAPAPGESRCRFLRRFAGAEDWWRSRDTGIWDGSPQGARELNLRVAARPDVYYFSWATEQTTRDPLSGRQVPEPGMSFLIYSQAAFIGGFGSDPAWWPNDGIVSTCSMDGPSLGSEDRIVAWGGAAGGAAGGGQAEAGEPAAEGEPQPGWPQPGLWNFMGVLRSCDHLDLIGIPCARRHPGGAASLTEFYAGIAAFLAGLPE
jgi:triacylglycerol lipase